MTTIQQSEALRLADALRDGEYSLYQERDATEAELRRLHDLLGKANALSRIRAYRISELESQLEAIGAGGVESLRKKQTMSDEQAMSIVSDAMQELGISFTGNGMFCAVQIAKRAHEFKEST